MKSTITKREVEHIANLGRLEMTEKEKFQTELSLILNWIKDLQKIDLSKVEPTAQITGLQNIVRQDKVVSCDKKTIANLVEMAPEKEKNLIKVKAVFE